MQYERMKYGHDQREWVKTADELLPELIAKASKAQEHAAAAYAYTEWALERNIKLYSYWFEFRRAASNEAIMLLNRVLYYQGMRNANLPRES